MPSSLVSQIRRRVFKNSVSHKFAAAAFGFIAALLIYQGITQGKMMFNRSIYSFSESKISEQPFFVKFGSGPQDYATFALAFWKTQASPLDLIKDGSPVGFNILFQSRDKQHFIAMRPCKPSDFPYHYHLLDQNIIKFSFCIDNTRYPNDRQCPDFIDDSDCPDPGFTLRGHGNSDNNSNIAIMITKCSDNSNSSSTFAGIKCMSQPKLDEFWKNNPSIQARLYFTSHSVELGNYTSPFKPKVTKTFINVNLNRRLEIYQYYEKVVIDDYDSIFWQNTHSNQTSYSTDSTKNNEQKYKLSKGKYPSLATIVLQSYEETTVHTRKYPSKFPDLLAGLFGVFSLLVTVSIWLFSSCFKKEVQARNDENPELENPIERNNAPAVNVEGRQTEIPLLSGQGPNIN